jgi:hypothetical protein
MLPKLGDGLRTGMGGRENPPFTPKGVRAMVDCVLSKATARQVNTTGSGRKKRVQRFRARVTRSLLEASFLAKPTTPAARSAVVALRRHETRARRSPLRSPPTPQGAGKASINPPLFHTLQGHVALLRRLADLSAVNDHRQQAVASAYGLKPD